MELLRKFGLTIHVGEEVTHSPDHQIALLTLVNTAFRTLLGGVEVVGLPDVTTTARVAYGHSLGNAIQDLGGRITSKARPDWPRAVIGTTGDIDRSATAWRLTWEGWRGGVIPLREDGRLAEKAAMPIAPALAAATCAAEAFAYHAGDNVMAGRRSSGLSLWDPGVDWRSADPAEPLLAYLPSRLWIIGLGNLGQAYAWLLGCLPYPVDCQGILVLQDFDHVTAANESTSLLTSGRDINHRKTRLVADWLERRGFETIIEERRFSQWTRRGPEEPGAALCGVDNALARLALEKAGFDIVVEAGLGAGPQGFRNISMHTFPALRTAEAIWSASIGTPDDVRKMPAYQSLQQRGMDGCGLRNLHRGRWQFRLWVWSPVVSSWQRFFAGCTAEKRSKQLPCLSPPWRTSRWWP